MRTHNKEERKKLEKKLEALETKEKALCDCILCNRTGPLPLLQTGQGSFTKQYYPKQQKGQKHGQRN